MFETSTGASHPLNEPLVHRLRVNYFQLFDLNVEYQRNKFLLKKIVILSYFSWYIVNGTTSSFQQDTLYVAYTIYFY